MKFFSKRIGNGGPSWLIVFLGNPGERFDGSRHNVGFLAGDLFASSRKIRINKLRFNALTEQVEVSDVRALLMKPRTYMNLSGNSVAPAAAYYKIPGSKIIVVSDDIALPAGKLRIRRSGSAGGHNGLKNIISTMKSEDFIRIRIGVGSPSHPGHEVADWVLGVPHGQEAEDIRKAAETACLVIEEILKNGVDSAMNKFNS